MLTNTHKWSHAPGNTVVPSRWQATIVLIETPRHDWGIRGMPGDELNLNYTVER